MYNNILTVLHLVGTFAWVAGLAASFVSPPESSKKVHLFMDMGAMIAMVFGVWLLCTQVPSPVKMPWMHGKLTAVIALLFMHAFVRVRGKKIRRHEKKAYPPWAPLTVAGLVGGIIFLVVLQPF